MKIWQKIGGSKSYVWKSVTSHEEHPRTIDEKSNKSWQTRGQMRTTSKHNKAVKNYRKLCKINMKYLSIYLISTYVLIEFSSPAQNQLSSWGFIKIFKILRAEPPINHWSVLLVQGRARVRCVSRGCSKALLIDCNSGGSRCGKVREMSIEILASWIRITFYTYCVSGDSGVELQNSSTALWV